MFDTPGIIIVVVFGLKDRYIFLKALPYREGQIY